MAQKICPYTKEQLQNIDQKFSTPFHLYDEKILNTRCKNLNEAFNGFKGFKEFFAVKTTPTPALMRRMHKNHGFGMDCSSLGELILCEKIGITGEEIMFTSNNTSDEEFRKASELKAIINLDDISLIDHLDNAVKTFPELICFRINPGGQKDGNVIIGSPLEAKYGLTLDQIIPAYKKAKDLGAKRFGLHTMVASNELSSEYFPETVQILIDQLKKLKAELDIEIEFINIGGGFGVDYKPEDSKLDIKKIATGIEKIFSSLEKENIKIPNLYMENGRWITAPAGFLVTKVRSHKNIYRKYVGVDACMADLMRPGMYGAYHHISVPGKEDAKKQVVDVVGSLCENNDKFAIQREIPVTEKGDLVVIHDAGGHGRSMGFNYNAKLRTQEILFTEQGETIQIRRKETLDDYFATIEDFMD